MANRSLQAKFELSRRQAREAAWLEFSKSGYATCKPVLPDEAPAFRRASKPRVVEWFDDRKAYVAARLNGRDAGRVITSQVTRQDVPLSMKCVAYDPTEMARIVPAPARRRK